MNIATLRDYLSVEVQGTGTADSAQSLDNPSFRGVTAVPGTLYPEDSSPYVTNEHCPAPVEPTPANEDTSKVWEVMCLRWDRWAEGWPEWHSRQRRFGGHGKQRPEPKWLTVREVKDLLSCGQARAVRALSDAQDFAAVYHEWAEWLSEPWPIEAECWCSLFDSEQKRAHYLPKE